MYKSLTICTGVVVKMLSLKKTLISNLNTGNGKVDKIWKTKYFSFEFCAPFVLSQAVCGRPSPLGCAVGHATAFRVNAALVVSAQRTASLGIGSGDSNGELGGSWSLQIFGWPPSFFLNFPFVWLTYAVDNYQPAIF